MKDIKIKTWLFVLSIIIFICLPLYFFFYKVPSTAVIEGEKDIYSEVTSKLASGKNKTYDVMVTYKVFKNNNNTKTYLMPLSINWSNGGRCHQDDGEYGISGETVTLIAQDGKEYKVKLPFFNDFNYLDQLSNANKIELILYIIIFISTGYISFKYIIQVIVNKKLKEIEQN